MKRGRPLLRSGSTNTTKLNEMWAHFEKNGVGRDSRPKWPSDRVRPGTPVRWLFHTKMTEGPSKRSPLTGLFSRAHSQRQKSISNFPRLTPIQVIQVIDYFHKRMELPVFNDRFTPEIRMISGQKRPTTRSSSGGSLFAIKTACTIRTFQKEVILRWARMPKNSRVFIELTLWASR